MMTPVWIAFYIGKCVSPLGLKWRWEWFMMKSERFIFAGFDDCKVWDFLYLICHKPLPQEPFLKYCPWVVHVLLNHTSAKRCYKHFHHSGILLLHTLMCFQTKGSTVMQLILCVYHPLYHSSSLKHIYSKQETYNNIRFKIRFNIQ